ncbi:hypothetical protein PhaeoP71_01917 [Phaeobacter piscinae]|nr:hypothetical protein PhaeoP71_01917 [Phaeobacter piscinae]
MSVRLHLLARWYEARSRRAYRRYQTLKARAERIRAHMGWRA